MANSILPFLGGLAALVGVAELAGSAPSPAQVTPPPETPPGYDLVPSFAEEFDGRQLDRRIWLNTYAQQDNADPEIGKRALPDNGERQIYFDKDYLDLGIDPFVMAGGTLTILARPLDDRAKARLAIDLATRPPPKGVETLRKAAYSSGLISTRGRFAQKGGYFEIRARWSSGKGIWPAFWLVPADGSWPPEIDVMEAHGDKLSRVFHSVHKRGIPKSVTLEGAVPGTTRDYHRYGVLWLPDRLDYFIDGVKTASIPAPPDMTKDMYLIANLAIGGYWSGYPDKDVNFPVKMEIDYIRSWRFRGGE